MSSSSSKSGVSQTAGQPCSAATRAACVVSDFADHEQLHRRPAYAAAASARRRAPTRRDPGAGRGTRPRRARRASHRVCSLRREGVRRRHARRASRPARRSPSAPGRPRTRSRRQMPRSTGSDHASFSRTSWLTAEPSARPAICGITSAITRPMSRMLVRLVLGDRVVDDPLELFLGERLGHELLEHRELALLLRRLLLAARASRNASAASMPLLALALEHLQLLVLGERALQVLLGRLEARRGSGAARRGARCRARSIASLTSSSMLLDQAHSSAPPSLPARLRRLGPPPRMCQCRWKTVWPAPGADVDEHTVVGQADVLPPSRRRTRASASSRRRRTRRRRGTCRRGARG